MVEKVLMTVVGEAALRQKLKWLKEVERPQVVKAIEEARAHGDLTENAEYHAAKEKQGIIEAQLRDIEDKLSRAEVIDPARLSGDRVVFGATVLLADLDSDEEFKYQIVGSDEAEPKEGKISYTAPLARALLGKQAGDVVQFRAPAGLREYKIVKVLFC